MGKIATARTPEDFFRAQKILQQIGCRESGPNTIDLIYAARDWLANNQYFLQELSVDDCTFVYDHDRFPARDNGEAVRIT